MVSRMTLFPPSTSLLGSLDPQRKGNHILCSTEPEVCPVAIWSPQKEADGTSGAYVAAPPILSQYLHFQTSHGCFMGDQTQAKQRLLLFFLKNWGLAPWLNRPQRSSFCHRTFLFMSVSYVDLVWIYFTSLLPVKQKNTSIYLLGNYCLKSNRYVTVWWTNWVHPSGKSFPSSVLSPHSHALTANNAGISQELPRIYQLCLQEPRPGSEL